MPEKRLPVTEIKVQNRYRKEKGDLLKLIESIRDIGLLHPIVVNHHHVLLAGERRLLAVQKLGWTDVPVHVVNTAKTLRAEQDENVCRLDLLPSEKLAIANDIRKQLGDLHEKPKKGRGKKKDEPQDEA